LAGTIPLADPEHDTPWPVAALVSDVLVSVVLLAGELLPVALLAAGLLAELDGDWLTAVLVAAAPLECRAW
jgi:hypothetical protein